METKMFNDLLCQMLSQDTDKKKVFKKLSRFGRFDKIRIKPFIEEEKYSNWLPFILKISVNNNVKGKLISFLISKKSKKWWKNAYKREEIYFLYSNSHWKNPSRPENVNLYLLEIGKDPVPVIKLSIS